MDLIKIRDDIDKLDDDIIEALKKRIDILDKVIEYKIKNNKEVLDIKREEEKLRKIFGRLNYNYYSIIEVYRQIMRMSRLSQYDKIVVNDISLTNIINFSCTCRNFEQIATISSYFVARDIQIIKFDYSSNDNSLRVKLKVENKEDDVKTILKAIELETDDFYIE